MLHPSCLCRAARTLQRPLRLLYIYLSIAHTIFHPHGNVAAREHDSHTSPSRQATSSLRSDTLELAPPRPLLRLHLHLHVLPPRLLGSGEAGHPLPLLWARLATDKATGGGHDGRVKVGQRPVQILRGGA